MAVIKFFLSLAFTTFLLQWAGLDVGFLTVTLGVLVLAVLLSAWNFLFTDFERSRNN